MYTSNNLYYLLFYVFIQIFYCGIFLSLYQLDFFTGFLWLVESVVIFVSLLLLFYLSSFSETIKFDFSFFFNNLWNFIIFFVYILFNVIIFTELEFFLPIELNVIDYWSDYYEALNNISMNDAYPFMLSYYLINSLEFILVVFLLLIGSIVIVNLNKNLITVKLSNYNSFLHQFFYLKKWFDFVFLRKQNTTTQQLNTPLLKIFKKKIKV